MKISFLGQGFEPESVNSVGNILSKLFKEDKFHSFTGISAFASVSGSRIISKYIQEANKKFKKHTLFIGVDQEGTSKEALESINTINIDSYIFHQRESPIFHPKIYLFEGDNNTALIIGSSNLTGPGLFSNVESSILVEFKNKDVDGINLVSELKSYFHSLFNLSDPNLFKVSKDAIDYFVDKGIVPTEKERKKKYTKNTTEKKPKDNNSITIPSRKVSGIPKIFKGIYKSNPIVSELIQDIEIPKEIELIGNENYDLLWESNPLSERDLNIPTGANTHRTGSMTLNKGKTEGIDQRHYFRENVFLGLEWQFDTVAATSHMERAVLNIRIIIQDIDYGVFSLHLKHNTKKDSRAYIQNNSMSEIKWGEAKNLIRDRELIGKTLFLLKNKENGEFIIDIK